MYAYQQIATGIDTQNHFRAFARTARIFYRHTPAFAHGRHVLCATAIPIKQRDPYAGFAACGSYGRKQRHLSIIHVSALLSAQI